jgi:hypothetical protein
MLSPLVSVSSAYLLILLTFGVNLKQLDYLEKVLVSLLLRDHPPMKEVIGRLKALQLAADIEKLFIGRGTLQRGPSLYVLLVI